MNRDEQRILITQAQPGMELTRPVQLPNQVILLAAGTELTDAAITQCLHRDVRRIHVRGNPLPAPSHEGYAEVVRRLRSRFSRVRDHAGMRALEQAVESVLVRHL